MSEQGRFVKDTCKDKQSVSWASNLYQYTAYAMSRFVHRHLNISRTPSLKRLHEYCCLLREKIHDGDLNKRSFNRFSNFTIRVGRQTVCILHAFLVNTQAFKSVLILLHKRRSTKGHRYQYNVGALPSCATWILRMRMYIALIKN